MSSFTQQLRKLLIEAVVAEALGGVSVRQPWGFMVDGVRLWLQSCLGDSGQNRCKALYSTANHPTRAVPTRYLSDLLVPSFDWFLQSSPPNRTQEAASLVLYIVEVYGRERLPLLLRAFGEHNSWYTLMPAIFGLSALEFERAWQAYY